MDHPCDGLQKCKQPDCSRCGCPEWCKLAGLEWIYPVEDRRIPRPNRVGWDHGDYEKALGR